MTSSRPTTPLVCPHCREPLEGGDDALGCRGCDRSYPVSDGVADFAEGRYYDEFTGPESLSEESRQGLGHEVAGTTARIADYYLPRILAERERLGGDTFRVLDSGCGNGISIDLLADAGVEAWGNDVSRLRQWQWRERLGRERLVVADSRRLPFADGFFQVVLSSGVIEHIGVEEHRRPGYEVAPLPERDAARSAFLGELLRVLDPAGCLFLDCPNGAFPIDFWHGDQPGEARFHSLREGFLPTVAEVRSYVAPLGRYRVTAIGPRGRLRMKQVGRHLYGRALRLPMEAVLAFLDTPVGRPLAGSLLNPYLVMRVEER
ncbi:MAG: methyltransferase domain-containing protein [Acidobacteria bacterium]|nr:methyltransferase domain-containing protein [Acidobacteriota bacterium]